MARRPPALLLKNMAKSMLQIKKIKRLRRHNRIRKTVLGTSARPRLSVFKSHRHVYAQLIDDMRGKTLASASDLELKSKTGKKTDKAKSVGELIAKKAKEVKIKKAVFDRGGFKYHGRIKSVAEGARIGGLIF